MIPSTNDAFLVCQRLQSKVLKLVDISYGGENGFNQAIELSTEVLSNVKFIQEKKLIGISEMQLTLCNVLYSYLYIHVCLYETRCQKGKRGRFGFFIKLFLSEVIMFKLPLVIRSNKCVCISTVFTLWQ